MLIFDGDVVGQIEYAPSEFSGYPISSDNLVVMNCIWVLRKGKEHNFGRMLVENMVQYEKDAVGFATIAVENHWSPGLRKAIWKSWALNPLTSSALDTKLNPKSLT